MLQSRDSPNLDLLRSVAVLAVFADHVGATFGFAQKYDPYFWALGRWGVLLFFVHTSLVLMMSMERLHLNGLKLFKTFYIRRLFRIYPLSMVAVAVTITAQIPPVSWAALYEHPPIRTILSNFFLYQNLVGRPSLIGPLWSLPLEIQMYLMLPVLFIFIRKTSLGPLVGIWLASVLAGIAQPMLGLTRHGRLLHIHRLGIALFVPCFLAGVAAYYIALQRRKPSLPFWFWPVTLLGTTVAYLGWEAKVGFVAYPEWICCLAVGLVVVCCTDSAHLRLNRLTHLLARYSYGLYLGQVSVLWFVFVKLRNLSPLMQWPLFLFLIIAVPVASYHLIEHPFIRLGARLTGPQPERAAH